MDSETALHVPAAIWSALPSKGVPGSQEVLGVLASLSPQSLVLRSPTNELCKDRCLGKVVMLLDVIRCTLQIILSLVGGDDHPLCSYRPCLLDRGNVLVDSQK